MPDQDPNAESAKRTLSEISHLFLSDVRDRHTGGALRRSAFRPDSEVPEARPFPRRAPTKQRVAARLRLNKATRRPTTLAHAGPAGHRGHRSAFRRRPAGAGAAVRPAPGRADRCVGLIEIDGPAVRIACFEPARDAADGPFHDGPLAESEVHDPRSLAEAIDELDWDVRHWLLVPASLRTAEIRSIMSRVGHWALLSTCDHDGIVSSYRALKGMCDAVGDRKPLLTLSLLDAGSDAETVRVFEKVSGVCRQFLDWPVEPAPSVLPAPGVTEEAVLVFQADGSGGEEAGPWMVLEDLVARANAAAAEASECDEEPRIGLPASLASIDGQDGPAAPPERHVPAQGPRSAPGPTYTPAADLHREPAAPPATPKPPASMRSISSAQTGSARAPESPADDFAGSEGASMMPDFVIPAVVERTSSRTGTSEVLEISSEGTAESILAAILSRPESGLVECPVRTPMCPSARLTIDRDRRVILLAVAREGLAELRSIGQAYRWLIENRALIGMAVPQLAIDAHQFPRLRLLVDQADASADVLQPMLQSGHVAVQTYRRVRWGDRTGLLLDAA